MKPAFWALAYLWWDRRWFTVWTEDQNGEEIKSSWNTWALNGEGYQIREKVGVLYCSFPITVFIIPAVLSLYKSSPLPPSLEMTALAEQTMQRVAGSTVSVQQAAELQLRWCWVSRKPMQTTRGRENYTIHCASFRQAQLSYDTMALFLP